MLFNLSDQNSVAAVFLKELRDVRSHTDRLRFRKNLERLGEILAYEISKKLSYKKEQIQTPLDVADAYSLVQPPVLIGIMRAGIPFMQGFINFFDSADCGFVGAYRQENEANLKINMEYCATPQLKDREVIIVDPMLATGSSLIKTITNLKGRGIPAHIHVAAVIASPEGIDNVVNFFRAETDISFRIWTCAVDLRLDPNFYIVPGLGDAGDLSFGVKLD
jgi:uracil phosphoribosyltransferase